MEMFTWVTSTEVGHRAKAREHGPALAKSMTVSGTKA